MRKLILLIALAACVAVAQVTTLNSTDPVDYRTLNANFAALVAWHTGTSTPTINCAAGKEAYFDTVALKLYWCSATNTWTDVTGSAGGAVSSVFGRTGAIIAQSGDYSSFYALLTDPRFTDSRTPTAHASTHKNGGNDEVATATPAANAIPKAGGGGQLATGWIPDLSALYLPLHGTADQAAALTANPSLTNPDLAGTALSNTVTAGTGGVTAGHVVQKTADAPIRYANASSATAQVKGIARTTATVGNTFQLATSGVIGCVVEGAVTSGHYWTYGTTDPSKCKDTGQSALASISNSVRIGGVFQASGTDGQTVNVSVLQNASGAQVDTSTVTGAAGGKCIHTDPATKLLVETAGDCGTGGGAVSSVFGRTGAVVAQSGDYAVNQLSAGVVPTGSTIAIPEWMEQVAAVCTGTTPSIAFDTPASSAPLAACKTGTNTQLGVAQFTSAGQTVQFHSLLPDDWTSVLAVEFRFLSETAASTGSVVWNFSYACIASSGASIDPSYSVAQTVTVAAGANNVNNIATLATPTISGCSAGQRMFVKLGLDAGTTAAGNQDLISVRIKIKRTVTAL